MTLKYIEGNLITFALNGDFDVIIHGCNCFCKMGSGIAKEIRTKFPEAYEIDQKTIKGDKTKLGDLTYCKVQIKENPRLFIVNAYTQFRYGYDGKQYVDYNAVKECMRKIKKNFSGKKIGLPQIGCGLAGGEWEIVSKIIETELYNEDITIVLFKP